MHGKTARRFAIWIVICLLVWIGAASAESIHTERENSSLEVEVHLGYGEQITYGKTIPIRVTVKNRGEDLEGILAVNTYATEVKYDRYEAPISVPAGGERTVVLPVTAEVRQEVFTIEILRDGEVICAVNSSPEGIINPSAMMIGVLSTRPRNLANLDINQENDALYRYEYWQTVALTPETLPDEAELLNSFGMIVLDDTDPSLLTEKQQKALTDWVAQGRVLLCGGGTAAPGNLDLIRNLTGLRASEFTVSDGVLPALEGFVGQAASGKHPEAALARISGGTPLLTDAAGNGLIWRETAGAGRIYILAWEAGDAALNAESLMHTFFQQMLIRLDSTLYNGMLFLQENNGALAEAGDDTPLPLHNSMPVAAAIAAGVILIGLILWFVLKKRGATQWMWAVLPALALAAAAAVTVMAQNSAMNRPVAAVTVNQVQDADGVYTRYMTLSGAVPGTGMHRWNVEGENLKARLYEEYWGEEEEDAKPKEPVVLRTVRTLGPGGSIAVQSDSPWNTVSLYSIRTVEETGRIDAEIWMESDGFHGVVTNNTGKALKEGAVLSVYGFVRIPALAPGESADFALIAEDAKDPANPAFEEGKMLRNASVSFYTMVNWVCYGTATEDYDAPRNALAGMMSSAASYLSVDRSRNDGSRNESMTFIYSAQPEEETEVQVSVDGQKVETVTEIPLITAAVQYRTVGRTGILFRVPGMDTAVRCRLDEKGLPDGDMPENSESAKYYTYYELSELPTFRFTPEEIQGASIDRMVIGMEQWYMSDLKCYVLNAKLRTWVEITPNTDIKRPEMYLDRDGNLYCQFRPASSENHYVTIPAPTLTLEGRVKDAET